MQYESIRKKSKKEHNNWFEKRPQRVMWIKHENRKGKEKKGVILGGETQVRYL